MPAATKSTLAAVEWDPVRPEYTIGAVAAALGDTGLARISRFPASAQEFIDLLGRFGEPLGYYGSDAGTHPEHSAIWRIKYDPASASRGETHAVDGPLLPHSSQSLRDPRPRFFAMLMVDSGWQDNPPGENGESVFAAWRYSLERLAADLGADYPAVREALLGSVPYPDGTTRPVAYRLPDEATPEDLGVRLKSDLLAYLEREWPELPATAAVRHLAQAASATALHVPLNSGDVAILDNDRWAHGRLSVVGHRTAPDGATTLNPRELWSATVA